MAKPKVSVVAVVNDARPGELVAMVGDFLAQGYANSELVMFSASDTGWGGNAQIKVVIEPGGKSEALAHAEGDLVTFWQAHNRHHPDLLDVQVQHVSTGLVGCCLTDCCYFFPGPSDVYIVDFRHGPVQGCGGMIPSTLMVRRAGLKCPTDDPYDLFMAVSAKGTIGSLQEQSHLLLKMPGRGGYNRAYDEAKRRGMRTPALAHRKTAMADGLEGYTGTEETVVHVKACDGSHAYDLTLMV